MSAGHSKKLFSILTKPNKIVFFGKFIDSKMAGHPEMDIYKTIFVFLNDVDFGYLFTYIILSIDRCPCFRPGHDFRLVK